MCATAATEYLHRRGEERGEERRGEERRGEERRGEERRGEERRGEERRGEERRGGRDGYRLEGIASYFTTIARGQERINKISLPPRE